MANILDIQSLTIDFKTEREQVRAVDNLSISLAKGESLGIVGESGSGKSVTALSIMRLLATPPAQIVSGKIIFQPTEGKDPIDLCQAPENTLQHIRGKSIAMIFQEPMTSLNPVFTCGFQVTEAIQLHQKADAAQAKAAALALFEQVKLPDPERIFDAYPHQISGGQKQRVMIAMAMSCQPDILIADEPTTALDVTVQKAILELLADIRKNTGLSMIFISHDLGVIAEVCDRVAVMYKGQLVESGSVETVFKNPEHPYTRGLVACRPSLEQRLKRMPTIQHFLEHSSYRPEPVTAADIRNRQAALYQKTPILQVEQLKVRFPGRKNWLGAPTTFVEAVKGVSFDIYPGETFGLAGESGCGKTTLGRTIARLTQSYSGAIRFEGKNITHLSDKEFQPYRTAIQVVFQDPYSSLNPRMTIGDAIMEPMQVHRLYENGAGRKERALHLLQTVGLDERHFQRYPHEFSGGQRQRICLARALSLNPRFLVCDEMVSALDVSVQATILNLLMELQAQFGLTYLFISHDLSVIKQMCDRLLIMKDGEMQAIGDPQEIFESPPTPYVKQLMDAIPGRMSG